MEQDELKEALKNAWPVECMKGHGAENRTIQKVGTVARDFGRYQEVYQDNEGDFWYRTLIGTERGIVTEYEAIFGRPEKRA